MNEDQLNLLRDDAHRAMHRQDYKLALDIYEKLAAQDMADGIFMTGVICEHDWDESLTDLDKAYQCYNRLAIEWNDDSGYLGCVRVILEKKDTSSRDKALTYCRDLVKGKQKCHGFLTMGRVYDELFDPPKAKLARAAYFRSFLSGSSWALRQYAISLMRSKKYIRGILMHVVATLTAPFLVLFGGWGATGNG